VKKGHKGGRGEEETECRECSRNLLKYFEYPFFQKGEKGLEELDGLEQRRS